MINAIIKGIFGIITMLANVILTPIVAIITGLFPSLRYCYTVFNYISYNYCCLRASCFKFTMYTT